MPCSHASPVPGCPDCAASSEGEPTFIRPSQGGTGTGAEVPDATPSLGQTFIRPNRPEPEEDVELPRGTQVGRYMLLHRIGKGGMGQVYAAFDPELERKVAIKLLRASPGGSLPADERHSRLLREAQAMARLSHPHVVPVHDVGLHASSVFVAMEFVDGLTLHEWMRQRRPWREVLEVVIAAGRGLAAAHAAGLVHRDFKPANVLRGHDGRVRVTDFGLARATSVGDTLPPEALAPVLPADAPAAISQSGAHPLATPLTIAGTLMGTPGYMAPEQYLRQPATPQTDQFCFCITLYEALYGERPFPGKTLLEQSSAVLAGGVSPPPPGAKVPGWVRRILLKGLSASPAQRFASMDALLDRLQKNPAVVRRRAYTAAVIALVAWSGVAVQQVTRAQRLLCTGAERRLAGIWDRDVKARAEEAFLATDQPFAANVWAESARRLDAYAERWVSMHEESCEATRIRGEQPESVWVQRTICLDARLKELEAVSRLLVSANEKVVEKAVDAANALSPIDACADVSALSQAVPPPSDPAGRTKLEAAQRALAEAKALLVAGQPARALELIEPLASLGQDPGFRSTEAEALLLAARAHTNLASYPKAEDALITAVQRADAGKNDAIKASALSHLVGLVGYIQARGKEGRIYARLAEGAITRAGGDDVLRAELLSNVGDLEWRERAFDEALRRYREALALRTRALGPDHTDVASILSSIGWVLMEQGHLDEAAENYERSLAIRMKVFGPNHPIMAIAFNEMGALASERKRYAEAVDYFQRIVTTFKESVGAEHPRIGAALFNLGAAEAEIGQLDKAVEDMQRGMALKAKAVGEENPEVAMMLVEIAQALRQQHHYQEALERDRRALDITVKGRAALEYQANAYAGMKDDLIGLRQHDEAVTAARRALELATQQHGADNPRLVTWIQGLGEALTAAGKKAEALGYLERAVKLQETDAASAERLAEVRFALARSLWDVRRDRERARKLAQQALEAYARPEQQDQRREVERWLAAHP